MVLVLFLNMTERSILTDLSSEDVCCFVDYLRSEEVIILYRVSVILDRVIVLFCLSLLLVLLSFKVCVLCFPLRIVKTLC